MVEENEAATTTSTKFKVNAAVRDITAEEQNPGSSLAKRFYIGNVLSIFVALPNLLWLYRYRQ